MHRLPLKVQGAREHNLKDLTLEIPHDIFVALTGRSGSGKSSLAFSTVFAEGQRRYIETFSPYTRQFFDKVKKPEVDLVDHVRPAVSIQQRTRITNSRSTVGSITNLNDHLRLLWTNLAEPRCPDCGRQFEHWETSSLTAHLKKLTSLRPWAEWLICAYLTLPSKETTRQRERERLLLLGYSRCFDSASGKTVYLEETFPVTADSRLLVVLDRVKPQTFPAKRARDSIQEALELGRGDLAFIDLANEPSKRFRAFVDVINNTTQPNQLPAVTNIREYSTRLSCKYSNITLEKAKQALFSYNHPMGACPNCKGFGYVLTIDPQRCVPNPTLSIKAGALQCWSTPATARQFSRLKNFCQDEGINTELAWKDLSNDQKDLIFTHNSRSFRGVLAWFKAKERKAYKMSVKMLLKRYRSQTLCPVCEGRRLIAKALHYQLMGLTLPDLWQMPINDLYSWLNVLLAYERTQKRLPRQIRDVFGSILSRLQFLIDLGLSYLSLDRPARTLSGGETQRVNLAAALGSELVSTQFVLDEPSVGLHARDTARLIRSLQQLQQRGNSLLVVEHDQQCLAAADHIIELGPIAGSNGGQIVYNGPHADWHPRIVTTPVGEQLASDHTKKRPHLTIKKAIARNLKGFTLDLPLNALVGLAGVSGSGKSTLATEVIKLADQRFRLGLASTNSNVVLGLEQVEQVLFVDQSGLAKNPRANIATYTKIWDRLRTLLAETPDAATRALGRSAFSFNVDQGRCPACKGAGYIREDMQFLSDVFLPCETCLGQRFQQPVLEVRLNGLNVADLLNLTVSECADIFTNQIEIAKTAEVLCQLGLGYLTLGHSLSELSGGEAQRLKLMPFIQRSACGNTLLIFDEPTTGLHDQDVVNLINLLRQLRNAGHSILCIEHNLRLLAEADWLIELGPDGGNDGGKLVLTGPPSKFLQRSSARISPTAAALQAQQRPPKKTRRSPAKLLTSTPEALHITGACEHNLKNVSLSVPLDQLVAITGVSGSGKSTIAKDIIYAEGQRRYLDCLSPYARQFIKELKRPNLESIKNVRPTICVYQHTFQPSQLSTIGTISEVYSFLRLLYSKIGTQFCPDHPDQAIAPLDPAAIAALIPQNHHGPIKLLAQVVKGRKGNHRAIIERAIDANIGEVRVDGNFLRPSAATKGLARNQLHTIEYVVGHLFPERVDHRVMTDAISQALSLGGGAVIVHANGKDTVYSTERTCPICRRGFFRADPEELSFNSARGRCKSCHGTGLGKRGVCRSCNGSRLGPIATNLRIKGHNIYECTNCTAPHLHNFLSSLELPPQHHRIATPILQEVSTKLEMLIALGLDYLPLNRDCSALSSGELQRLRLAAAIGSPLSGALYIFDEPSAGLHPNDNERVLQQLRQLIAKRNGVLVIEHDSATIRAADYIIDVGPGGGAKGGRVVYSGSRSMFFKEAKTTTATALRATPNQTVSAPLVSSQNLTIVGGNCNNLQNLNLTLPLQTLVVVAGVSGAGKSSLVHGIIANTLTKLKAGSKQTSWQSQRGRLVSSQPIDRLLLVDQQPIGANARSTPASYLGLWNHIRSVFAGTVEAKTQGWDASYFSYNTGRGRCPNCQGRGEIKLEMSFLPEAHVTCENCNGRRFSEDADSVRYRGYSISEVLKLTFEQARELFAVHPRMHRILHQTCNLGLDYLTLGQASPSLSGGESQRLKLVAELAKRPRGHTLYILDEPTTGLHRVDVEKLLLVLKELIALGNSIMMIEHDPDVLQAADHLIELGPGPGPAGGKVIFEGHPSMLRQANTPWSELLQGHKISRKQRS